MDGYVSLEVSPLLAYEDRGDDQAGRRAARPRRRQRLHQDPGHAGGPARHRGVDLRRRADQRHAAVLDATRRGRRRGLHEGDRAADRGRARPRRALGALASSSAAGTSPSPTRSRTSSRTHWGRGRQARPIAPGASCSSRIAGTGWPKGRAARSGCSSPARAPRTRRLRTRSTSRHSPRRTRSTRCPTRRCEAFADHGKVGDPLPEDGGDAEQVMQAHREAGIDTDALALRLQKDGAEAFVKSWTRAARDDRSESERLAARPPA